MANEYVPERALEPKSPSKRYESQIEYADELQAKADKIYDFIESNFDSLSVAQMECSLDNLESIKEELRELMIDMNDYSVEDQYDSVRFQVKDVERWIEDKVASNGKK